MVNTRQIVPRVWGTKCSVHPLIALFIMLLLMATIYLSGSQHGQLLEDKTTGNNSNSSLLEDQTTGNNSNSSLLSGSEHEQLLEDHQTTGNNNSSLLSGSEHEQLLEDQAATGKNSSSRCNFFTGKWVFDNKSYPLYKEQQCPYMWDEYACEKYGRKDRNYQNWRWQPHQCDLPRFNATALLERLRGKRLVFVGDSMNRNYMISLVCLVESSIPQGLKSMNFKLNGSLINFEATEYNATIDFYWSPLLVESNSDDPLHHHPPEVIVRVEAIEEHARHWTDADILVFNSYLWWLIRPKMKVLWGSFQSSDGIYKDIDAIRSYEMALKTWSDWLEIHFNHTNTKVFFVSRSPMHQRAEEWGMGINDNCYNETMPIFKEGYHGSESNPKMNRAVEAAIDELKTRGLKVQMLNITQLSEYRKEGHSSIYRRFYWTPTEEQLSNPKSYADCAHWCLPGVPDTWNEILYSYILHY